MSTIVSLEFPVPTIVSLEYPISSIVSLEYPVSTIVSLEYRISTIVSLEYRYYVSVLHCYSVSHGFCFACFSMGSTAHLFLQKQFSAGPQFRRRLSLAYFVYNLGLMRPFCHGMRSYSQQAFLPRRACTSCAPGFCSKITGELRGVSEKIGATPTTRARVVQILGQITDSRCM